MSTMANYLQTMDKLKAKYIDEKNSEGKANYINILAVTPVSLLAYLMKIRISKDTIALLYLTIFITTY